MHTKVAFSYWYIQNVGFLNFYFWREEVHITELCLQGRMKLTDFRTALRIFRTITGNTIFDISDAFLDQRLSVYVLIVISQWLSHRISIQTTHFFVLFHCFGHYNFIRIEFIPECSNTFFIWIIGSKDFIYSSNLLTVVCLLKTQVNIFHHFLTNSFLWMWI